MNDDQHNTPAEAAKAGAAATVEAAVGYGVMAAAGMAAVGMAGGGAVCKDFRASDAQRPVHKFYR